MSANGDTHSHGNHDVRFEETDVATRPVVTAVVVLSIFTLVFTGIAHLYFHYLASWRQGAAGTAGAAAANKPVAEPWVMGDFGSRAQKAAAETMRLPVEPRLQVDPKADLIALRAQEAKALGSYGWVDQNAGVAHVPISKAKEMLLAQGLPAREGPVPPKMAEHHYAAPAQPAEGSGAPDWFGGDAIGHDRSGSHAGGGHGAAASHGAASEAHGH
jgi:hypothetical protein